MGVHFKLPGVFEGSCLCNIPKMSAFAALLGTGKPVSNTGVMCKGKTTFIILRYFIVYNKQPINFPAQKFQYCKIYPKC